MSKKVISPMTVRKTFLPEKIELVIVGILYGIGVAVLLLTDFFLIFLAVLRPSTDAALINYVALVVINLLIFVPTAIWATLELIRRLKKGDNPIPQPPRQSVSDLKKDY